MGDVFSKKKRSEVMASIRSTGNRETELTLARIFRAAGICGWRRRVPLFGKPDFVFRRERVAVFVDGCFWHGCPLHGRIPKSNNEYWVPKLRRNKLRDREVTKHLSRLGWKVIRLWDHDLKKPEHSARKVIRALRHLTSN